MPIRIECSCGKVLNVPDTMAGQKGKCPGCGAMLTVPKPGEQAMVEEETRRWKYRGPKVSVAPLIMGSVVFLLLAVGGIVYYSKKTGAADAIYKKAMWHIQKRQFFEAEALLKKVVEKDPNYADAYIGLGNMALEKGDFEEAQKKFEKAREVKPGYPKALERMGVLYLRQDNIKKAKKICAALKKEDEKLAQMLHDDIMRQIDPTFGVAVDPNAPKKDASDVGPVSE
ncbi:MAG: tetratricopeptide repeat protein [Planctomycetes bacterium]|nr:tetratricopeptide repeat protein [Planctomycetota bacterium]